VNKNTTNTALHTSGKDVQDKARCIVGVYCDWVYTTKCIVGVYCDWVYNASSGCTGIVGIYSDWVYNAKCTVGTTHMLKTKPFVLWVHNTSYIVGVSGNYNSDTRVGLRNIVTIFCTVAISCVRQLIKPNISVRVMSDIEADNTEQCDGGYEGRNEFVGGM